MKTLISVAALVTLAACGQSAPKEGEAKAAAPAGPHSNAAPGTYTEHRADHSMVITHLDADGSYTNWVAGAMTESGKWAIENNKTCFHPSNDGKVRCGSDGPMDSDGTFTVTPDEGAPFTVTKTA